MTWVRRSLAFHTTAKPPPPSPENAGLTRPSARADAVAASPAVPPWRRVSAAAREGLAGTVANTPCEGGARRGSGCAGRNGGGKKATAPRRSGQIGLKKKRGKRR